MNFVFLALLALQLSQALTSAVGSIADVSSSLKKPKITESKILYIPEEFRNLFIFGTGRPNTLPTLDSSFKEVVDFIEDSIPFKFKSVYKLTEFFLVTPDKSNVGGLNGTESPTLALFFDENSNQSNKSIDSNQFWNSVVDNWIEAHLLQVLLASTFCTFNTTSPTYPGYCINISDSGYVNFFGIDAGSLLRAFLSDIDKNNDSSKSDFTFKMQVANPEASMSNRSSANIVLSDEFWRKQVKNFDIAQRARSKIQEKLVDKIFNSNERVNVRRLPLSDFQISRSSRSKSYSQILRPSEAVLRKLGHRLNGKLMRREDLEKVMAASSEEEKCAPVSWYNVFHNSVFGKPKLCSPEK